MLPQITRHSNLCTAVHLATWHAGVQFTFCLTKSFFTAYFEVFLISLIATQVFPCFFLSCKANCRVKLAKTGHGPHSSQLVICVVLLLFVLFYVLFVCNCVLYYCHRVATQLQLINISYLISFNIYACII
jgi:hypothetical protein